MPGVGSELSLGQLQEKLLKEEVKKRFQAITGRAMQYFLTGDALRRPVIRQPLPRAIFQAFPYDADQVTRDLEHFDRSMVNKRVRSRQERSASEAFTGQAEYIDQHGA